MPAFVFYLRGNLDGKTTDLGDGILERHQEHVTLGHRSSRLLLIQPAEGDHMYNLSQVLNQEVLHIQIYREDDWFIAKCVDIPGCISQGRTKEEALANIQDAIKGCISVIEEDLQNSGSPDTEFSMEVIPLRIGGNRPDVR